MEPQKTVNGQNHLEKEGNPAACDDMDVPGERYAE